MKMKRALATTSALCGLTIALAVPTVATAENVTLRSQENVTLRSQDGTIEISGEYLGFENNIYLIRTALGELRLSAERVRCEGFACPDFSPEAADVVFAGSETMGTGVLPLMLEGYAGYLGAESTIVATGAGTAIQASFIGDSGFGDPLDTYEVNSTGSSDAFTSLLQQTAQIGMAARRITPDEARALRNAGAGNMISPDQEHIVAIDSLVVITHPDNPVRRVTMEQLAGIYSGAIKNWSQVGGPDQPITVVDRPQGSGTQSVFIERVIGEGGAVTPTAVIAQDNNEMASLVNEDPGAIGYTGYAFQRGAKPLSLVNACGISMVPDAFSARTEEYALQRRLYLYNRNDVASDATQDFLDFALSSNADDVIVKAGFIDLGVDRRAQLLDSDRGRQLLDPNIDPYEGLVMREMLATMGEFDRLSTTFRFRTGSSNLDPRAVVDMQRLTEYLEGMPQGTRVKLVGFTDSVGAFEGNRQLAERRAAQVLEELRFFAGGRLNAIELSTAAYGEIAPTACNDSDTGRAINRRVEVWIESQA